MACAALLLFVQPCISTAGPQDLALGLRRGDQVTPSWSAQRPNYQLPNAGLPLINGSEHFLIFTPDSRTDGTYSHGAQIERHDGYFHVSWNNSPYNEDQDGQRSMYSSSADGRTWSEPIDIFPSMPASRFGCTTAKSADADADADADEWSPPFCYDKIHQHSMPYATLNGRLYAVSTIRRHQEGAFFYPQPADDLNATLLRRVLYPGQQTAGGCAVGTVPSGACPNGNGVRWLRAAFGPMFWATDLIPHGYDNVTQAFGIRTASQNVTAEEGLDLAAFRDISHARKFSSESCRNGPCGPRGGEQTVYSVKDSDVDVILYRGQGGDLPNGWPGDQACANASSCVLLSTSRNTSLASNQWGKVVATSIPDLGSNLNAGTLSDGRIFLVWNGVPRPSVNDTACGRKSPPGPCTIAPGQKFTADQLNRPTMDGMWAVYSINKEEIGITFAPSAGIA
eukprot:gene1984-11448_t